MKIRALLTALALCTLPAFAQAGDPGSVSFAFQIGWNIPEGEFSNYAASGYGGSLDVTYNLSRRLAFRTELGRAANEIESNRIHFAGGYMATIYNYNLTENLVFTLNPEADTNVYLIAGAGGYRTTAEIGSYSYYGSAYYPGYPGYPYYGYGWGAYYPVYGYNPAVSRTTTRWGYNAGIGVQYKISPGFVMSLESRYTMIATQKNIEYVPIAIGFRFM